ncbi:MAG: EthD family reductase [Candidatus Rokuibacteriota bacterium]|nr:MAG: EthD family reductase [Candidatus Rokubacteria bacterium]
MIRVSVHYPSKAGAKFDHAYYAQKHMVLVRQRLGGLGLIRAEIDKGLAGGAPGSAAPFLSIGYLYFNTLQDFQKAMKAHGTEVMGDLPNFTNVAPEVQISEVVG